MESKIKKSRATREDFRQLGRWIRKRIQYRFQKKTYTIEDNDLVKIASLINIINWLTPKIATKKWFQKLFEPSLAGKPGGDRIQGKVVPLNAIVKDNPKAVMPYDLIDEVIEKASFRLILHECMCRKGMECEDYPIDFACLFVGDGARFLMQGDGAPGREATAEEAKAHIRKAEELGLVPLAAYVPIEQKIFGVPDDHHHQFFEFCFCCPCCCVGLRNLQYLSTSTRSTLENVGFVAKALPECRGCLKCISVCPVNAINKNGSKVWVNEDECVGCGLCQYACKHDAIQLVQVGPSRGGLLDYFEGVNIDVS